MSYRTRDLSPTPTRWPARAARAKPALRALGLVSLAAGVTLAAAACAKDKPTRAQCEQACAHAVELGRAAYDKAALARIPPDKQAEARTKMRAEWRKARKGKFKDRIDDCAVQCVSEGDMDGVQCVLAAKTLGEAHRCRARSGGASPPRRTNPPRRNAPPKIGPRPLQPPGSLDGSVPHLQAPERPRADATAGAGPP